MDNSYSWWPHIIAIRSIATGTHAVYYFLCHFACKLQSKYCHDQQLIDQGDNDAGQ